jgi:hypothetical protein
MAGVAKAASAQESSSFLKKRTKKLLSVSAVPAHTRDPAAASNNQKF